METADGVEIIEPPDGPSPDTPNPDGSLPKYINIRVNVHDEFRKSERRDFSFMMKENTPFEHLINRVSVLYTDILPSSRFIFIGEELSPSETPLDKSMDDGDSILLVQPWPKVPIEDVIKFWPKAMWERIVDFVSNNVEYHRNSTEIQKIIAVAPAPIKEVLKRIIANDTPSKKRKKKKPKTSSELIEIVKFPKLNKIVSESTDDTVAATEEMAKTETVEIIEEVSSTENVEVIEEVSRTENLEVIEEISKTEKVEVIEEVSKTEKVEVIEEVSKTENEEVIEEVSKAKTVEVIDEVSSTENVEVIEEVSRTENLEVIEEVSKTEKVEVMKEVSKTEKMEVIEEVSKIENVKVIEEVSKTGNVEVIEEVSKTKTVEVIEEVSKTKTVEVIEVLDRPEDVKQPPLTPKTVNDKTVRDPVLDTLFMLNTRLMSDRKMMATLLESCNRTQLAINNLIDFKMMSLSQTPITQTRESQPQPQENQSGQVPMSTAFIPSTDEQQPTVGNLVLFEGPLSTRVNNDPGQLKDQIPRLRQQPCNCQRVRQSAALMASTNKRRPTTGYPVPSNPVRTRPLVSKRKIAENDYSEGRQNQIRKLQQPYRGYRNIRVPEVSIVSTDERQKTTGNSDQSKNCSFIPSTSNNETLRNNVPKDNEDQTQQFQQQSEDLQCVRPSADLTASTNKQLPMEQPRKKRRVRQSTAHTVHTNERLPNAGNFVSLKRPTQSTSTTTTSEGYENNTQQLFQRQPRQRRRVRQSKIVNAASNSERQSTASYSYSPTWSTMDTSTDLTYGYDPDSTKTEIENDLLDILLNI